VVGGGHGRAAGGARCRLIGRLAGFSAREVRRVAESEGWVLSRTRGDRFVYRKPGVRHNLSIPDHRELEEALMRRLVRDLGLSVDDFLERASK
jgi:predicted RNA binding protein YcfA (HicA-like mRNA interferase family)